MLDFITWDVDPILIHFGDGGIRWYGLCWALGIYICWIMNERMYKHENCPAEWTDQLFFWITAGAILGARIGHCLFYEWHQYGEPWHLFGWEFTYRNPYIEHPLWILKIWEGGLASHGGTIGIIIAAILLNKYKFSRYPQLMPKIGMFFFPIAAALVRNVPSPPMESAKSIGSKLVFS